MLQSPYRKNVSPSARLRAKYTYGVLSVAAFREKIPLWQRGSGSEQVLVAYSGGADSTALLDLLVKAGFPCVAAHLHHGMRAGADQEMRLCEAFANELDVPFLSGRADVPRMSRDFKIGIEEAGRKARQEFLGRCAAELGIRCIATGHTFDDHVETMLFHMARGSGLKGLGGIPYVRDNLVRPLRGFSRLDTREYCEREGLWFHDDPANDDEALARVRIRKLIVPELRAVHPGFDASMERLSEVAREEDAFLTGVTARLLDTAEAPLNGNLGFLTKDCEIALRRDVMAANPSVLRRRAILLLAKFFGASLPYEGVVAIDRALESGQVGGWTSEGDTIRLKLDDRHLHVALSQPTTPFRYPLTVPGETESVEFGWTFTTYPTTAEETVRERGGLRVTIDPAKAKGDLYFRTAQSGDKISPLGMDGSKSVADILSEAKLTEGARSRLPIVCDMVGPIWIPGCVLADRVRMGESTTSGLLIQFSGLAQANEPA